MCTGTGSGSAATPFTKRADTTDLGAPSLRMFKWTCPFRWPSGAVSLTYKSLTSDVQLALDNPCFPASHSACPLGENLAT